jgi:hypothetical protein
MKISNNIRRPSLDQIGNAQSPTKSIGSLKGLSITSGIKSKEQPLRRILNDSVAANLAATRNNIRSAVVKPQDLTFDSLRNASTQRATNTNQASQTQKVSSSNVNSLTAATIARPLPDGLTDKAYDGAIVGAGGKAYPANTSLKDVPPVVPNNGQKPNGLIIYVNGIRTSKEGQATSLQNIANKTGAAVLGVHNSTESTFKDLVQSLGDKLNLGTNPAVDNIASKVYDSLKKGEPVHLFGHSQGALILSRALGDVRKRLLAEDGLSTTQANQLLSNVKVETFGGAAASYPDGPKYVHYVNTADPVPGLFGLGPTSLGDSKAGKGAIVKRFFSLSDVHGFDTTYLSRRVPFDQARLGKF